MSYDMISTLVIGSLRSPPLSGCAIGHTYGVRVHRVHKVQRVQRVVVAADAADFKESSPRPPVISTEAKRSEEISPSDGTGGITVGDLSTQSIMGAVPVCLP